MFHISCNNCRNNFASTYSKRLFCSRSCSAKKNNTAREKKNKTVCAWCGIDVWFKKGSSFGKYCSNKCSGAYAADKALVKNIHLLKLGKLSLRPAIKKALLSLGMESSCALCGLDSWYGQKLSLVLDHIDGNAANNCMENFRFLCPNCDSQSSFYKGRNKGRGRTVIGLRKSEKKLHT